MGYDFLNKNASEWSLDKGINNLLSGKLFVEYAVLEGGVVLSSTYYFHVNSKKLYRRTGKFSINEINLSDFLIQWLTKSMYGEFKNTSDSEIFHLFDSYKIKYTLGSDGNHLFIGDTGICVLFNSEGMMSINTGVQKDLDILLWNLNNSKTIIKTLQEIYEKYRGLDYFICTRGEI